MALKEEDPEISEETQLQEISAILAIGLLRKYRNTPPPPPLQVDRPQKPPQIPSPPLPKPPRAPQITLPREIKRLDCIEERLRRRSGRELFWLERVVSLDNLTRGELLPAICRVSPPAEFEFKEAMECAMKRLSPRDRKIAALTAERGITHAAREMHVSWRQIANAMVRTRKIFIDAGLGPD